MKKRNKINKEEEGDEQGEEEGEERNAWLSLS